MIVSSRTISHLIAHFLRLSLVAMILMGSTACGIKRNLRHPDTPKPSNDEIIKNSPMPQIDDFIAPPNEPPAAQRRGNLAF